MESEASERRVLDRAKGKEARLKIRLAIRIKNEIEEGGLSEKR